jgi:putative acetyltransferase
MEAIVIRDEPGRDHAAVSEVHRRAFPGETEARLVADLRRSRDVVISLVAERQEEIFGHLLFSRLKARMRALALAPVGVRPEAQNQGVGSALIRAGLERAARDRCAGVFVLGAPDYYERFGFSVEAARRYTCAYSGEYFMMKRLAPGPLPPRGRLLYPAPFDALS